MFKDDASFHAMADKTIAALAEVIDDNLGDEIDVDIQNDILTLILADKGHYIINKNAPLHQVWLSSPKSGAWHFEWDEAFAAWRSTRGEKVHLTDLLSQELGQTTAITFNLNS